VSLVPTAATFRYVDDSDATVQPKSAAASVFPVLRAAPSMRHYDREEAATM
jgi:hypothetical protein